MSDSRAPTQHEFLSDVLLGNQAAVDFVETLAEVSQVWDDLIDRDVGVDDDAINAAFYAALVTLPMNPFYRAHVDVLAPGINSWIVDWMASNELTRGSEHDRSIAWVIRDNLCSLVVTCAQLVGGYRHAVNVAAEIHRFGRDSAADRLLPET